MAISIILRLGPYPIYVFYLLPKLRISSSEIPRQSAMALQKYGRRGTGGVPPEGSGWDADAIEEFIRNYMVAKPDAKGSKVLTDLAHELGFEYRKPVHGPAIARHIRPEVISDLKSVFADLFA